VETEQTLAQVREELSKLKRECDFLQRNRGDLESALRATQEEKSMVERELHAIRSQLNSRAVQSYRTAVSHQTALTLREQNEQ
jgi:chromosome segregation ATPase